MARPPAADGDGARGGAGREVDARERRARAGAADERCKRGSRSFGLRVIGEAHVITQRPKGPERYAQSSELS